MQTGEIQRLRALYLEALRLALANVYYDFSPSPHSATGLAGLSQLQTALEATLTAGVSGDLLSIGSEPPGVGVWLSGLLDAYGERGRRLWLAGADKVPLLPPEGDLSPTERIFLRYSLLDARLRLLPDWDSSSLATLNAPLALLRLGPGLPTNGAGLLAELYGHLSPGACVLTEPDFEPDFRADRPLHSVSPGYWRKPQDPASVPLATGPTGMSP